MSTELQTINGTLLVSEVIITEKLALSNIKDGKLIVTDGMVTSAQSIDPSIEYNNNAVNSIKIDKDATFTVKTNKEEIILGNLINNKILDFRTAGEYQWKNGKHSHKSIIRCISTRNSSTVKLYDITLTDTVFTKIIYHVKLSVIASSSISDIINEFNLICRFVKEKDTTRANIIKYNNMQTQAKGMSVSVDYTNDNSNVYIFVTGSDNVTVDFCAKIDITKYLIE